MFIKQLSVLISSSMFALISQCVCANNIAPVTCPTIDEVKQFSHLASFPFGYNSRSNSLKSIAVAGYLDVTDDGDDRLAWALVIHPIEVSQSETPSQAVKTVINQLVPVSNKPFNYSPADEDDSNISVCVYMQPGHQDVHALAYYVNELYDDMDDEDDDFAHARSKVSLKQSRMLKIAKHVTQFIRQ